MAIDAMQAQLVSAVQRLSALQRRLPVDETAPPKLVERMLRELENALEEVRVSQDQLIDSRRQMEELQAELSRQYQKYWDLFDDMPQAYVVTRADSTILEANRAAGALFNVSQRFLVGKTLSVFVSDDRVTFLSRMTRLVADGGTFELEFRMRPRERAAIPVQARVAAESTTLRWVISAVSTGATTKDGV
jgi:two-component system, OmpR family, sensor histidine kinase VicK